jgi:hypothetical protein
MGVKIQTLCFPPRAVPPEDEPPLEVYANGMEALQIPLQLLEMVSRRHPQILVRRGIVNHLELSEQTPLKRWRNFLRAPVFYKESPKPFIPESRDHFTGSVLTLIQCTTH